MKEQTNTLEKCSDFHEKRDKTFDFLDKEVLIR